MPHDPPPALLALGEPSRARIALALLGGQALTSSELAAAAGISRPTASSHLERLVADGVLSRRSQGRHRYFQLATPQVAQVLEGVLALQPHPSASAPRRALPSPALCHARVCYDHLAGELAVRVFDGMVAAGLLVEAGGDALVLPPAGAHHFARLGLLDPDERPAPRGRPVARACLDWTARRSHLAGTLGQRLLQRLLDEACVRRQPGTRALVVGADTERRLRAWGLIGA